MELTKIQAIYYNEPHEEYIYCILAHGIDGDEFAKKLNSKIEGFNKDIALINAKEEALRSLYNCNKSFIEITGGDALNAREPKYPNELPKGMKNHQTAYPEIALERKRREEHNKNLRTIYSGFMDNANEQVRLTLEPLKKELIEKWPEFKRWIRTDSYDRKIYYDFYSYSHNYVSKDLI